MFLDCSTNRGAFWSLTGTINPWLHGVNHMWCDYLDGDTPWREDCSQFGTQRHKSVWFRKPCANMSGWACLGPRAIAWASVSTAHATWPAREGSSGGGWPLAMAVFCEGGRCPSRHSAHVVHHPAQCAWRLGNFGP